jgi:hypothetical protein
MAMALLAGCFPQLYTDVPLGEPAQFKPSEWDGLWLCTDQALVRFRIGVPGIRDPAITESWRECDATQAGLWQALMPAGSSGDIRHHGDWYFLPCEGRLATGEPCEMSLVARRVGMAVYGYWADEDRIRKLMDEGKVPGRIELIQSAGRQLERVVLHSLTADHYRVLFGADKGAFRLMIGSCVRLPAELDPCNKPN